MGQSTQLFQSAQSFPLLHMAEQGPCFHCAKHSSARIVFSVPTAEFTSIAFGTLSNTEWVSHVLRGDPVFHIYLSPSCAREFFKRYISPYIRIPLSTYDTYYRPLIRQYTKTLMRIYYFRSSHCPDSETVFNAVRNATPEKRLSVVQKLFRNIVDVPGSLGMIRDTLAASDAKNFQSAYAARIDQYIQCLQRYAKAFNLTYISPTVLY